MTRSYTKSLLRFAIAFVIFMLLIAFIFLPRLLSTSIGKQWIAKAIEKKIHTRVSIQSVNFTWFGPQSIQNVSFSNPEISGMLEQARVDAPFWSMQKIGHAISIQNTNLRFLKYQNIEVGPFNMNIENHQIMASGLASQGGRFNLHGIVNSQTDFDLIFNCSEMPSGTIDALFGFNGYFASAAGSAFDLFSTVQYNQGQGNVFADFSSPHSSAVLKGAVAQDVLFLKEPFQMNLQFSPELARALKGAVLNATSPITLQIEKTGTSIPIKNFAISRMELGNSTLDLGKLIFAELHPLISLFALLKAAPIASSNATVWFTPAHFSIQKGIFHLGRVDVLIENAVHLCGWGDAELVNGKLNGKLGIPADTLNSSLGIQNLPRNFVLLIPVKGSIAQPQYETGAAATTIAAWIAGGQLPNIFSKKTGLFKGMLNQINSLQQEGDVPPPMRPFPWET
ncbi:MAG TPA: hypothetical protein VLE95_00530 [Chlamydiales bacterium]|nr:hypothetical protein [Chlamydiales bacterium]